MNDSDRAIPLQAVKSSNVAALGYDAPSRRFAVQFKSGGLYHYEDVPAKVADAVMTADSAGKAVGAHLVNKFKFTRADDPK